MPAPADSASVAADRGLLGGLLEPGETISHASGVRASFVDDERGPQVFAGAAGITGRALVLGLHPTDSVSTWYGPVEGRIPFGIIVGDPASNAAGFELEYRRPEMEPGSRRLQLRGLDEDFAQTLLDRIQAVRARRSAEVDEVRSRLEQHLPPGQTVSTAVMVQMSPPVRGSAASGDFADGFIALTSQLVAYGHLADPPAIEVHPRAEVGCWVAPQDGVVRLVTPSSDGEMTRRLQPRDPEDEWVLRDLCDYLDADN